MAFNSPDYYAEIFSSAIDQFNQQQMQLQQQQQVQLQIQLNSSPKNAIKGTNNVVDAVEEEMVKKFENEKKEKERQASSAQEPANNFMIFERHFEDKDIADTTNTDSATQPSQQ